MGNVHVLPKMMCKWPSKKPPICSKIKVWLIKINYTVWLMMLQYAHNYVLLLIVGTEAKHHEIEKYTTVNVSPKK